MSSTVDPVMTLHIGLRKIDRYGNFREGQTLRARTARLEFWCCRATDPQHIFPRQEMVTYTASAAAIRTSSAVIVMPARALSLNDDFGCEPCRLPTPWLDASCCDEEGSALGVYRRMPSGVSRSYSLTSCIQKRASTFNACAVCMVRCSRFFGVCSAIVTLLSPTADASWRPRRF